MVDNKQYQSFPLQWLFYLVPTHHPPPQKKNTSNFSGSIPKKTEILNKPIIYETQEHKAGIITVSVCIVINGDWLTDWFS